MAYSGKYVLVVKCDHKSCKRSEIFEASSQSQTVKDARKKGWRVTMKGNPNAGNPHVMPGSCFCTEHIPVRKGSVVNG